MIDDRVHRGLLSGVSATRTGVKISHLLFADDSLAFMQASDENCDQFLDIPDRYRRVARQAVNFGKSSVFFSNNVDDIAQERLKQKLGISKTLVNRNYLGLPIIIGRKKQSVPTFAMSLFNLPKGFCESLETYCAKFFWGTEDGNRKMHFASWKRMCSKKKDGGLGFRTLEAYNLSLIAKQDIWHTLLDSRVVLLAGGRWHVGNGHYISVFNDKCIRNLATNRVIPEDPDTNMALSVNNLMARKMESWNFELLRRLFGSETMNEIASTPIGDNYLKNCTEFDK
ncbi:uncharacterized protein [Rutidosis leptorrhynchoides]|uniref:uncharacterized protein n=1 Tax=Rutidosis leptorrhynchoides TaxID=125765 RepID=UPI003A991EEB